ncbi:cytochrome P450, partial [Fusarium albosuccineum]
MFSHLREEKDVGQLRKTIFDIFKRLSCVGHLPRRMWLAINTIAQGVSRIFGADQPMIAFRKWSARQIQNRLDNPETAEREDLLAHFCRMRDQKGNPASFGEILIEAMNLIGAGADTTSIGMRTCLYYVATNPDAYAQLRREVDDFYRENNLDAPITYLETQQLPYLQAVIKEATRLLPSIVFQLLRYAPPGFEVRGVKIPANTPIGMSPIAQNRDQDIWGQDADEFRPSRWLENEEMAKYFDRSTMTFGGSGPRMCIGRNIAL